jgi:hypothetical protein
MTTDNNGKEYCFEIITKQRVYQLVAKSQADMLEWMKALSVHTILHAENAVLAQAGVISASSIVKLFVFFLFCSVYGHFLSFSFFFFAE